MNTCGKVGVNSVVFIIWRTICVFVYLCDLVAMWQSNCNSGEGSRDTRRKWAAAIETDRIFSNYLGTEEMVAKRGGTRQIRPWPFLETETCVVFEMFCCVFCTSVLRWGDSIQQLSSHDPEAITRVSRRLTPVIHPEEITQVAREYTPVAYIAHSATGW